MRAMTFATSVLPTPAWPSVRSGFRSRIARCTEVATGASVTYCASSIICWIFRISSRMARYCTRSGETALALVLEGLPVTGAARRPFPGAWAQLDARGSDCARFEVVKASTGSRSMRSRPLLRRSRSGGAESLGAAGHGLHLRRGLLERFTESLGRVLRRAFHARERLRHRLGAPPRQSEQPLSRLH